MPDNAWAQAVPQIAASVATICVGICATLSLYIRTKNAEMNKRLEQCENMCKDCESHKKEMETKVQERDFLLNTEWPSNKFDSDEALEKIRILMAQEGIRLTLAQIAKMVQHLREKRK